MAKGVCLVRNTGPFAKRWAGDLGYPNKEGQPVKALSTSKQTEIATRLYHAGIALWAAVVAQGAAPPIESGGPKQWIAADNDRTIMLSYLKARKDDGTKLYSCASLEREYNKTLNECLLSNRGLIAITMRKFIRQAEAIGLTAQDLEQEGYIGVLKTIQKYDPDRSAFSTYLYFWIYQSMNRAVQNASLIHTPPNRKSGTEGLDLKVLRARHPLSMNAEITRGDGNAVSDSKEFGDTLQDQYTPTPEEALTVVQDRRNLGHSMSFLTPRESRVIRMRYYEDLTLSEAGEAFKDEREGGLTRERIRQIECGALETLRDHLDPDEANLLDLCDKD